MRYNFRRLKQARKDAGLDLTEAARRAGLQTKHLSLLEAGLSVPKADTLARIAAATGKTADFFFDVAAA